LSKNPPQVNKIQIFNKIDSSKLKTKSNSITSNMSGGVNNNNNNTSNNSRSKNTKDYNFNKNKITNVSYLKKNEQASVRNESHNKVDTLNSK
jgi:hypothetical protein